MNKREFERAVAARMAELMAEQIEQVAQARMAALVNGAARKAHSKAPHPIKHPKHCLLKRGEHKPEDAGFRMTRNAGLLVSLAWQSLSRGESFSGRATRADLTAYLKAAKPEATGNQISAALSEAIKRGVLAPANA